MTKFSRRVAMRWAGWFALGSVIPSKASAAGAVLGSEDANITSRLTRVYSHRDSAATVGRAYLAQTPRVRTSDGLIRLLSQRLSLQENAEHAPALEALNDQALQTHLAEAIKADFAAERVVEVDGWVLAQTEAQLCALTALHETT